MKDNIAIVVIGRNEGERLKICLGSALIQAKHIVYVDSGSSDGSVAYATSLSIDVVQLDMRIPFSAARARNDGFQFICQKHTDVKYVQFIDGDCELIEGWLGSAIAYLDSFPSYAVVAGRRIERFPERSIYNRLCDIEWNSPIGDAKACGGDFLIRRSAFESVDGFNPNIVAGEEPDLCYRLSAKKWKIRRIDSEMTLHDSAMFRFSQWWKRATRTGHAYAQGFALHINDRKGYYAKESLKCWIWALGVPLFFLLSAFAIKSYALLVLMLYPARFSKIAYDKYRKCHQFEDSILFGFFTVLASWPQFSGQIVYLKRMVARDSVTIIEYK